MLKILMRRRKAVLLVLLIGIPLVVIASRVLPVTYSAHAYVMMLDPTASQTDPTVLLDKALDMPTVLNGAAVLEPAIRASHAHLSLQAVRDATKGAVAKDSSVMEITYSSRNQSLATRMSNAIADSVVQYYRDTSASQYGQATTFLNASLARQRDHIRDLDLRLETAAARNASVGSEGSLERITTDLALLEQKRGEAYATLTSDRAAANVASGATGAVSAIVHQELIGEDPAYRKLRDRVASDQAELAMKRADYTANYPGLAELRDRFTLEQKQLHQAELRAASAPIAQSTTYSSSVLTKQRADAVVAGDVARVREIDQEIGEFHRELTELPKSGVDIGALRLDRNATQAAYQALTEKLSTTLANQAEAATVGTVTVMDRAERAEAKGLSRAVLPLGLLTVLFIAISLPFFLELVEPRLTSVEQLEALYGVPVFAVLNAG